MYKLNNISTPKKLLETVNDLGVRSNPNILINGDFAINQRGAASYTGVAAQYTVDRWIKRSSNDTVAILTKGVRFTHGGSVFCWLNQTLEPTINSQLLGKTLTLSIKVNAVSLSAGASCRITLGNGATAIISGGFDFGGATFAAEGTYSGLVSIPSSLTNAYLNVIIQINNGTSGDYIDVEYAKLELGSIATPFVPPLTAEELPKCQRYYQRLKAYTFAPSSTAQIGWMLAGSTSTGYLMVSLPVSMRVAPTILSSAISDLIYSIGTTAGTAFSNVLQHSSDASNTTLKLLCSGTFTTGQIYTVALTAGGTAWIGLTQKFIRRNYGRL